jgi:hypothetical protein
MRISDIRELDQPDPSAPHGRRERLACFLGAIVSAGSMLSAGDFQIVGLGCRKRPSRRPCSGRIRLGRDPETDEIRWSCTSCGDQGVITHWQQTRWDLSSEIKGGRVVSISAERARRTGVASPLRRVKVYEVDVELVQAPVPIDGPIVRRIRLSGDHSLETLHTSIVRAFDRREDAPYEFMFGAPYDPETRRFSGPGAVEEETPWETGVTTLDSLGLKVGESFGYLFDFCEEWVHRITVRSARELAGRPVAPRVIECQGKSPPPELPPDDDLAWRHLDTTFPLTNLYGPYCVEEGPGEGDWLALDDLERQLLVVESHTQYLPASHPPIASMLLHALVHSLAETHLAEAGADAVAAILDECRTAGADRHAAIHELGEMLVRRLLRNIPPPQASPEERRRRRRSPSESAAAMASKEPQ